MYQSKELSAYVSTVELKLYKKHTEKVEAAFEDSQSLFEVSFLKPMESFEEEAMDEVERDCRVARLQSFDTLFDSSALTAELELFIPQERNLHKMPNKMMIQIAKEALEIKEEIECIQESQIEEFLRMEMKRTAESHCNKVIPDLSKSLLDACREGYGSGDVLYQNTTMLIHEQERMDSEDFGYGECTWMWSSIYASHLRKLLEAFFEDYKIDVDLHGTNFHGSLKDKKMHTMHITATARE